MKKRIANLIFALFIIGFLGTASALSKDEALNLLEQGQKKFDEGKYEEALKYYRGALEISRKLKIPQDITLSLNGIGSAYSVLGRYDEALGYHEEALKISRDLNTPQEIIRSLNGIGIVFGCLGRYDEALGYHKEALKMSREQNVLEGVATSLNGIGFVYNRLSRTGEALMYYEEALKTSKELKTPKKIAYNLNAIGSVYQRLARNDEALGHYKDALRISREINNPRLIGLSLWGIGGNYSALGLYDEAIKCLEESLKINRELKDPYLISKLLTSIGWNYSGIGQYEESLKYHEEALKINREYKMRGEIPFTLNNIGWVYLALKDNGKAEKFFKEFEKERNKIETGRVRWMRSAGLVETYLKTGKYREALTLLNERYQGWSEGPIPMINYHTRRGFAYKGLGKLRDASEEFLEAVTMTEEFREKVRIEREGFFEIGGKTRAYQGLVGTVAERFIKGEKKDSRFSPYGKDLASAAFYFSESTKARALLDAIVMAEKGKRKAEIPEKLKKKEQSYIEQLVEIDLKLEGAFKKGWDDYQWYKKKKDWLTSEFNVLIKELREKHPQYALLYYPKSLPPESLPLKEDELLLEYSIGDDASYIFVVKKGGVKKIVKISFGREALEEKVSSFMEPMLTKEYSGFSVKKAKELYDILLGNALGDVKEHEKIIIIPHGMLGLLPFESLVVMESTGVGDNVYVGDRYSLSYYQSATVLAFNRTIQRAAAERVLFALGNPVFSKEDPRYIAWKTGKKEWGLVAGLDKYSFRALATGRGVIIMGKDLQSKELEYRPLPETEREVIEISRIMGIEPAPPDVLLSVMANEKELKKVKLENYRYIHFATHADLPGEVQGINEPFIILSQVENGEGDDGFLTLSEVLGLKLNADMVVLSACLTGRGRVTEGEGVINFARAFQHAGAQSIVVSLWEVASDVTVEHMKTFYGYLKAGKNRQEALTLTRKEIKAKNPNPFFWAVFILHGEG